MGTEKPAEKPEQDISTICGWEQPRLIVRLRKRRTHLRSKLGKDKVVPVTLSDQAHTNNKVGQ